MPGLKDALKTLCSDANIVKETYYGSVHRASFRLNGEKADWDVFHIGIPFSPQRESELMRRFGLERNDLSSFYGNFEKAVVRHINLIKAMNDSGIPAIKKSVVEYRSVQYCPRMNKEGKQVGQDFYFISRPMESFVGSEVITQRGAYLQDLNNLAVRLLQTAKAFNENGFSIGAIDLDSCFYTPDETGKKFLKLGYSFYGTGTGICPEVYTEDVRAFIPEEVAFGNQKQNLDSDVRMICAYIWTMLDGKHYTEPNLNAWIAQKFYAATPQSVPANMRPRFAPTEISTLLAEGMTRGSDAMRMLQTDIRQLNKRIASGELSNTFIPFEDASYLQQPLPELREEPEEEEEDSKEVSGQSGEDIGQQPSRKKKPKIVGIIIAVASLLILTAGFAYLLLGMDGIHNLLHPVHYSMSSESNVYAANGKVVNDKLQVYSAYRVDENGNIVEAGESGTILFPKEFVSEYVFVENVKLTVIEKHYSSIWNGTEINREIREGVIDLRGAQDLFYSYEADAVNKIPESIIDKYGIQGDSLILIDNDADDPGSFAVVMLVDMSGTSDEWQGNDTEKPEGLEEPEKEAGIPVQEIQHLSDSLLYKIQGEWRNKIEVSIEPEDATNSRITLTSEDPDHMYFIITDETGKETKTKSIRLSKKEDGTTLYIIGNTEGKHLIQVESEDGSLNKKIQMTFSPTGDYAVGALPPRPTPTPIFTQEPVVTPSPEPDPSPTPSPTPTPVPWQDYSGESYFGGGEGDTSQGTAVEPIQTVPEPTPVPTYTPEPMIPLSCLIDHVDLTVGDTFRLGDYLDGIEGGYLTAIPSPGGIVSINQADGLLLTGVSPGDCLITISKGTESVSVSVSVS